MSLGLLWTQALADAADEINDELYAKGLVPSEDVWQTKVVERALEFSAVRLARLNVACLDKPMADLANQPDTPSTHTVRLTGDSPMQLARVRLHIDKEVMDATAELAERNGVSVTMQIAQTLREAAEQAPRINDEQEQAE
jgi:hypothetical protein